MHRGKKNRARLARRVAAWNELPAVGMSTPTDKIVRRADGKLGLTFRRPGSQNGRKS